MSVKKNFTLEYFRAIIAVAMADGLLLPEEMEFFESKAQELGFSIKSVNEMLKTPVNILKEKIDFIIDDVDFVTDIVAMAMVDGEIHDSEYKLCIELAERVGKGKDEIDNTILLLKKLLEKGK